MTTRTTGLLEPVVGVAGDDLVDFDLASVAKPDAQVAVFGVIVPAGSRQVSALVLFISAVTLMVYPYLEISILRAGYAST